MGEPDFSVPQHLCIDLGEDARSIVNFYCSQNSKTVSEAITTAIKLLKVVADLNYRDEYLGVFKDSELSGPILVHKIIGY